MSEGKDNKMFDKLDDILVRFEEVLKELNDPAVVNDQQKFRKLMKEQNDLAPIVEAYKAYKQAKQDVEDSLAILENESDDDMRELAKEELNDAKGRIEELEQEMKILLLPKDPNDDKNIVVEIRAGAGGDEQRFLQLSFIVCTVITQKLIDGRLNLLTWMIQVSVV